MKAIRRHLGWKLFFSYMIIIVVGVVSLAIVAEFITPSAFERHMANMAMRGGNMGGIVRRNGCSTADAAVLRQRGRFAHGASR